MIDPKKITPLLNNMTVEQEIGRGPNGTVYLAVRSVDGRKLALKHISIPTSEAQTKALIFAGAVSSENDAQRYYSTLEQEIKSEILMLNGIKNAPNLLKIRGYQVDRKITGVGCDIYILSDYCMSLPTYLQNHYITRLQAINLAIDLCSALVQLRENDLIHRDVRPSNIFMNGNHRFMLGDLGLVKLSELEYASMPDQQITDYSAPEVCASDAELSDTMDVYSVGMILYEIYNGGILPLNEEGVFRRDAEEELPAPKFADLTISEIILRACAFNPETRYRNPAEMKEALVLHLQRGNISNDPLDPTVSQTEADTEVDVAAIAAAVTAGQAAEGMDLSAELPAEDAENDDWTVGDENEDSQENQPVQVSLNDIGENDLLVPTDGEISVEDFLASVRNNPGLEVVSLNADGETETVPGYETEETLPEDTVYVDSADIHTDASASAVESPVLPEQTEEPVDAAAASPDDASEPTMTQDFRPQRRPIMIPADDRGSYDDGYENGEEYLAGSEEEKPSNTWKKVLISVIVLLVLAGGAFSLYTFKTDTVTSISATTLSSSSILVETELKNASGVTVVCSNAAGEVARLPYAEGGVTFTELSPSSDYSFTLESSAGKFLLGSKRTSERTNEMTNLTGFAATSYSAVSATLSLAGTGPEPDGWVVTLTAKDKEPLIQEVSGDTFQVDGLTPATTYTASIARSDGDNLGGTTSCSFTTMDYTKLSSFEVTDLDTDSISLKWAYTGTVPENWSIICDGDDDSSITQDVNGTEYTLSGLTSGVKYNITLTCPSLEKTELATISVGVPVVTVTNISSTQGEDGNIVVNWEFTGDAPKQWSISYSYESESETTPTMATSDTNSVTLEKLLPNANYTIEVIYADDLGVGGNAETTCVTAEASNYTKYGCTDPTMTLYALEDNPDELKTASSVFTSDQQIAFAIEVNYDATEEDKSAKVLYVIRDSKDVPVFVFTNDDGRTWPGTWTIARHTGSLPEMALTPGSYSFAVYFDGQFMASADFTVQ